MRLAVGMDRDQPWVFYTKTTLDLPSPCHACNRKLPAIQFQRGSGDDGIFHLYEASPLGAVVGAIPAGKVSRSSPGNG